MEKLAQAAWKLCYFCYSRFTMGAKFSLLRTLGDFARHAAQRFEAAAR